MLCCVQPRQVADRSRSPDGRSGFVVFVSRAGARKDVEVAFVRRFRKCMGHFHNC
jgi:hypothetical protein